MTTILFFEVDPDKSFKKIDGLTIEYFFVFYIIICSQLTGAYFMQTHTYMCVCVYVSIGA